MQSDPDPSGDDSPRRSRRWDASVVVALASVLVALVFNAVQVRNTSRALNESQRSSAFSTLTTMYALIVRADHETTTAVTDAVTSINDDTLAKVRRAQEALDRGEPLANVEAGDRRALKKVLDAQEALKDAIAPLDGVVAMLQRGIVPVAGARELWTNYLVCDYREVRDEFRREGADEQGLADYLPHLAAFNARHPGERSCILGTYE